MDETSVTLNTPVGQCWQKRGHQLRLPAAAYAQCYQSCRIIGAYNWCDNSVHAQLPAKVRTETVVQFLEWLTTQVYPDQALVVVMDNASYHHAAAVKALCALLEHRLQVVYLPPYCSNLNLIERYWKHLKRVACANRLFGNLEQLTTQLRRVLDLINPLPLNGLHLFNDFR
jgi:transposase